MCSRRAAFSPPAVPRTANQRQGLETSDRAAGFGVFRLWVSYLVQEEMDFVIINPIKEKLRRGQLTFGAWVTIPNPAVAEIMALAGFDFLVIDTEHGAINVESVQSLIQAMSGTEVIPLVRLAGSQRAFVNKILDTGPYGVIVPMVNSRDEAEAAVRAARFPPEGTRGIGLGRAHGFDPEGRNEYLKVANGLMLVGIQIEHREAVDRIEEIVTTPGIDLVFLGLVDLAGSFGYAGEPAHPEVVKAVEKVIATTRRAGVPLGIAVGGPEELVARAKQGFQFFHLGADMVYLGQACKKRLRDVRQAVAETSSP
jgi:2-keto-3-deoxy-L-rhamnonate aldolase RhmA